MRPTHNKQIKEEAGRYTPACEWPAAILSQAYVPQPAPIITGVICTHWIWVMPLGTQSC